jgi:hypothetical protein
MLHRGTVVLAFVVALVHLPAGVSAEGQPQAQAAVPQSQAEIWRAFAAQVDVGTQLVVRLRNGQRFRATLIAVRDDAVLLQPKTRVPVPVQPVAYGEIVTLERREGGGIGGGKAAAIGIASGAGTFVAILLIAMAAFD